MQLVVLFLPIVTNQVLTSSQDEIYIANNVEIIQNMKALHDLVISVRLDDIYKLFFY